MAGRKAGGKEAVARPDGPVRVYLITGADPQRKQGQVDQLLKEADPDFADFDIETMDPDSASSERILSGVSTVPFGSGRRVVLVKDVQRLDLDEQKRLSAGLSLVPASGLLILVSGAPIVEDGKVRRQSVVSTELAGAVRKMGEVVDFAAPKAEDLRPRLIATARALGKSIDSGALALLLQMPADDLRHAEVELEKAALHAGDSDRIGIADVEAVLSRGPDEVIFKLCDAVGGKRSAEALSHLAVLFSSGSRPDSTAPRTLVMLARQIRLLLQVRYLGEQRMVGRQAIPLTDAVREQLPGDGVVSMLANPRSGWMVDKLVGQARQHSLPGLTGKMELLLEADLRLKGMVPGGDDPTAVMQRLVVELCR
jgi:DNA polymerase III delta subunit